jgi:hypothetical protein
VIFSSQKKREFATDIPFQKYFSHEKIAGLTKAVIFSQFCDRRSSHP